MSDSALKFCCCTLTFRLSFMYDFTIKNKNTHTARVLFFLICISKKVIRGYFSELKRKKKKEQLPPNQRG